MKTLMIVAIAMMLAACSFSGTNPQPAAEGTTGDTRSPAAQGMEMESSEEGENGEGDSENGDGEGEGDAENEE